MKKMLLFRHALKDGPNNTIGPVGFAQAIAQGLTLTNHNWSLVAHGRLVRTKQTLMGLMAPSAYLPQPEDVLVVKEFGSDELFAEMTAPPEFQPLAKQIGNAKALAELHPLDDISVWAFSALAGFVEVFNQLDEEETAVAVSHSPTIELGIAAALDLSVAELPDDLAILSVMGGVELRWDAPNQIRVMGTIPPPRIPA